MAQVLQITTLPLAPDTALGAAAHGKGRATAAAELGSGVTVDSQARG